MPQNYNTTHSECWAVVWAVRLFCECLECHKFTTWADQEAGKWLLNLRDTKGKLARLLSCLSDFEFDVLHRVGIKNQGADALSRLKTGDTYTTELDDESLEMLISSIEYILQSTMIMAETPTNYVFVYSVLTLSRRRTVHYRRELPMLTLQWHIWRRKKLERWESFCKYKLQIVNAKPPHRLSDFRPLYSCMAATVSKYDKNQQM